jgi:Tol biopolymer transport system component
MSIIGQNNDEWVIVFYATHFYTNRIDHPGLYWMRDDGSDKELIVSEDDLLNGRHGKTILDISLSPDGRKVAYTTLDADDGVLIYDLDTMQISTLANGFSPVWSPDSRKIAFISKVNADSDVLAYEALVIDISTGEEQVVLKTRNSILEPESNVAYVWSLAWSPDGTMLMASIDPAPRVVQTGEVIDATDMGATLFSVQLNGSDLQAILPDNIFGYRPRWIDENTVYFICYTQREQPPATICEVNLETSEITTIGDFRDVLPDGEWIANFSILPDYRLIFTHSYRNILGVTGDIYSFDPNTNTVANLDENSGAMNIYIQWFDQSIISN